MKNTEKNQLKIEPHFDDKFHGNRNEKSRFPRDKQEVKETKITQLSLSRAPSNKNAEQSKVQVTIKSTGTVYKTKEKKTGALSPRAPEKLRKPCGRNESLR